MKERMDAVAEGNSMGRYFLRIRPATNNDLLGIVDVHIGIGLDLDVIELPTQIAQGIGLLLAHSRGLKTGGQHLLHGLPTHLHLR